MRTRSELVLDFRVAGRKRDSVDGGNGINTEKQSNGGERFDGRPAQQAG
jgi:hypothetical protein